MVCYWLMKNICEIVIEHHFVRLNFPNTNLSNKNHKNSIAIFILCGKMGKYYTIPTYILTKQYKNTDWLFMNHIHMK